MAKHTLSFLELDDHCIQLILSKLQPIPDRFNAASCCKVSCFRLYLSNGHERRHAELKRVLNWGKVRELSYNNCCMVAHVNAEAALACA
jgi:hypothetical protein